MDVFNPSTWFKVKIPPQSNAAALYPIISTTLTRASDGVNLGFVIDPYVNGDMAVPLTEAT